MRSRRNSVALFLLPVAGVLCFSQAQPPRADDKPASVEGEVRNSVSGLPVDRAHISLRRYNNGAWDKYGALTDAEGKFKIAGIPAANGYQVTVERVGFVAPLEVTRNAVTLKADEKKDNFKVKLIPVGAISGRALDADGQPVDAMTVQAEQSGRPVRSGMTDDRGQFRIGALGPGKYRVRAVPQALPVPPEIRTDGTAEIQYAATYHPGAIEEKGGTRVLVGPASDVAGIDIRMVPMPIVRMAGKVSGIPEGAKNVYVQVMQANGGQGSQGAQVKPDGSFEVWRPNPGTYSLRAVFNNSGEQLMSGVAEVEVGASDVENIGLRLMAPEDLHGQLDFDDEMAKQAPAAQARPGTSGAPGTQGAAQAPTPRQPRRISLRELNAMGNMKTADVSEDGAFTIPKVLPGKYMVSTTGYQAYVKSLRIGQTAGEGAVLDVSQGLGGAALTVTLSSAYGELSGTVQDDKGLAAGARVVLRDALPALRGTNGGGILLNAASGADGTYRIKSVAPGTYKLLVLDESETHAIVSEPSVDDYDERAETVEVRAKETVTRDLKVRPEK